MLGATAAAVVEVSAMLPVMTDEVLEAAMAFPLRDRHWDARATDQRRPPVPDARVPYRIVATEPPPRLIDEA
jgi:hypothetical protein